MSHQQHKAVAIIFQASTSKSQALPKHPACARTEDKETRNSLDPETPSRKTGKFANIKIFVVSLIKSHHK
jgi:hypothetical protein